MPLRFAILWCLARGIRHGYEMRRALGELTDGLWEINPGHVYHALRTLERDGFVRLANVVEQTNLPDRKEYALTDAGETVLAHWLGQPVAPERPVKDEALVKLLLLVEAGEPDAIALYLAAQRATCEGDRDALRAQLAALPAGERAGRLAILAAVEDAEASLRWLTYAESTLRSDHDHDHAPAGA